MAEERFNRYHRFGSDIRCKFDMDPAMSLCSGLEVLQQDCIKRLTTPKGGCFWDEDAGMESLAYINAPVGDIVAKYPAEAQSELAKDPRVQSSNAQASYNRMTETVWIRVSITASTGDTFNIVGNISNGYAPQFWIGE